MNIMLNTGKGGMEEVFLHYNTALSDFCEVISVISSECKHKEKAKETSEPQKFDDNVVDAEVKEVKKG